MQSILWAIPIAILASLIVARIVHRLPVLLQQEIDCAVASETGQQPPQHLMTWLSRRAGRRGHDDWMRFRAALLLCLVVSVLVFSSVDGTQERAALLAFSFVCIAIAMIDVDVHLVPDTLSLPLIWSGLAVSVMLQLADPADAIIGAIAGYMALRLVNEAGKLIAGRDGIGQGDMKLLSAIGAWFGWQALPLVLIAACLIFVVVLGIASVRQRRLFSDGAPFAPVLVVATFTYIVFHARFSNIFYF